MPAKTALYFCLASLAFGLLLLGYGMRKRRKPHAALMSAGMLLDLLLVLTLEFTKGAIATAMDDELTSWQMAHVATSTAAVLLYFPVGALGLLRLLNKGSASERSWHVRLGTLALAFRTLGYFFMFSMLPRSGT